MRKRASVLAICAGLVLASCGGDDDDAAEPATTEPAEAPTSTAPPATDAPASSEAPVATEVPVATDAPATTAPATPVGEAFDALYAENPHFGSEKVVLTDEFKAECEQNVAPNTSDALTSRTLKIGTVSDTPGGSFLDPEDPSRLIGATVGNSELLLTCAGIPFEFEIYAFDGLPPALESGRIDGLFNGLSYTDERAEFADFVVHEETFVNGYVLSERADELGITERLDMCGKNVAMAVGSLSALRHGPGGEFEHMCEEAGLENFKLNTYQGMQAVWESLRSGRDDIGFSGETGAAQFGDEVAFAFTDLAVNVGQMVKKGENRDLLEALVLAHTAIQAADIPAQFSEIYTRPIHPIPPEIRTGS